MATLPLSQQIDGIYRRESRRVFATLVRLLGDMDLAEDALQDAFRAATQQWPDEGIPKNPRSWLISTGRFKAIDSIRRDQKLLKLQEQLSHEIDSYYTPEADPVIEDDQLRLIFTCCHPALPQSVQVALTLREVCGLSTEAIAAAFLVPTSTMAQRLVRGKSKIKAKGIPYKVPEGDALHDRLDSVLAVIYLVFNEGYNATQGDTLTRPNLSAEAIRVCRLLTRLIDDPEVQGLLALMLLHESRRTARTCDNGEIVLLQDQDRQRWYRELITEAETLLHDALRAGEIGSYCLEAAIAAVHADAENYAATDWRQIMGLYDVLIQANPSPVVELNRAVAIAMGDDLARGLAEIDRLLERTVLHDYYLLHAARADLCLRLGRRDDAIAAYRTALELAHQHPQRRFLERRLTALKASS